MSWLRDHRGLAAALREVRHFVRAVRPYRHGPRWPTRTASVCPTPRSNRVLQTFLSSPFHVCKNCQAPLAATQSTIRPAGNYDIQVAHQVGDLIQNIQVLPPTEELRKPDLSRIADASRSIGRTTGVIDLIKRSGVSKGTMSAVLNGGAAGLGIWISIAMVADVSLSGLFFPRLWATGVSNTDANEKSYGVRRKKPPVDWAGARAEASLHIRTNPVSLNALSLKLGIDRSHMRKGLGTLAAELTEARHEERKKNKIAEVESLAHKIGDALQQRDERLIKSSARKIANSLGQGRTSDVFKEAYKVAMLRRATARADPTPSPQAEL